MSEREPIICNAVSGAGCMRHDGIALSGTSCCRGGLWENRSIAPHIIRVEPCDGEGTLEETVEEQLQPED